MASLTEAELKKAIKEDAPGQLYYLYGNEKFLIKLYYDKLVEKSRGSTRPIFPSIRSVRSIISTKSRSQLEPSRLWADGILSALRTRTLLSFRTESFQSSWSCWKTFPRTRRSS